MSILLQLIYAAIESVDLYASNGKNNCNGYIEEKANNFFSKKVLNSVIYDSITGVLPIR